MKMKVSLKLALLSLLVAVVGVAHLYASTHLLKNLFYQTASTVDQQKEESSQRIQVALLLDTSNSMDGLIEQAKSQLWNILLSLSKTSKNGTPPQMEVALYEYGNNDISAREAHVRQVLAFTTDMDTVSAALFALTTNGGDEFCAQVIDHSIKNLKWDAATDAMRLIFIAGNEGFNQGVLPYRQTCAFAKENDIVVNTIFCGDCDEGVRIFWKEGADLTGGNYSCINQNEATAYIATPYDDQLTTLNDRLNDTYIAYGQQGKQKLQMQRKQDSNASNYSKANLADRASFKASANYLNSSWDLVDAYVADSTIVKDKKALPEEMSEMTEQEVAERIEKMRGSRANIQNEIQELSEKRAAYLKEQREAQSKDSNNDLQESVLKAIEKQAKKKGFDTKE